MDLATTYLGLKLRNPLIASSSPLTFDVGNIRSLEDCGVGAVVLPSMFEEQLEQEAIEIERLTTAGMDSFAEALSYFSPAASNHAGPHDYLEMIRLAREAVDIPVIASLNGVTDAGWTNYARLLQDAGACAIELNVYFIPCDTGLTGRAVEERYLGVLGAVKKAVTIPVAMKLGPYFSSIGNFVRELDQAGADGFVLFNRFYQPDIDVAALRVTRDLNLSAPAEIRLPLLWIAVLCGHIRGSLAASTGVETSSEVLKYLMAGADVVMTTSSLLRHGLGHVQTLLRGLVQWLDARELSSLAAIRGKMSHRRLGDPTAFERANYIKILQGWEG
jgi:dihydroorotate dehydrogenase (fumarate)